MKRFLIFTHRWMGIVGGLLFIAWFISGIIFMYWTMPGFSNADRLSHLVPLDLSTARVEPMDAASRAGIKPTRLRVAMYYDGRPVYRFQNNVNVYADTGEVVRGRDAEQAADLIRSFVPDHTTTVRHDSSLDDIDLWTAGAAAQMPLHKIAVGDAEDTYYYVSGKTGEPVMKTDRASRFWGFWGPVVHQLYFTPLRRNAELWDQLIIFLSITGSLMSLGGLVVGVWMYSPSGRFRQKDKRSHSPYSGWMKWHHYAGLIFGFVTFTWIFSGGLAFNPLGLFGNTNPSVEQREAATGPLNLEQVSLERLRTALAAVAPSFTPKEADVLQFRGDLYLLAADGPPDPPVIGITFRNTDDQLANARSERRMVWLEHPERGAFTKFDDSVMMDIAREAMPNVPIQDATWLDHYDNYYRSRYDTQPLPVLRVRYANSQGTWLYIDPHRGTVAWREEWPSRLRRWLYNGLHKFDLPILGNRPVWDISMILLSVGGLVLSVTTIIPAFRRLRGHAIRMSLRSRRPTQEQSIRLERSSVEDRATGRLRGLRDR